MLRYVRAHEGALSEQEVADICASFQRVVVTVLIDRLFDAARRHQARSVGVAGGVSANSRLRAELQAHGERREIPTFLPEPAALDRQRRDDRRAPACGSFARARPPAGI